ncbi:hypothetical protein SAMN05428959_103597 [Duganella sp. CF517]|nr:hypothetical protein SAMN05428959_103597 [Duganella sp. CF517]
MMRELGLSRQILWSMGTVGVGMAVAVMVSLYIFYTLSILFYPESGLAPRRPLRLERTANELVTLTAAIAHELHTPVTILRMRLQGLAEGVLAPDEAQFHSLLRASGLGLAAAGPSRKCTAAAPATAAPIAAAPSSASPSDVTSR